MRSPVNHNTFAPLVRQLGQPSPFGYNLQLGDYQAITVAVTPRSPIGYNGVYHGVIIVIVAVTPRSPIGYNAVPPSSLGMNGTSCGYSPISHRL